MQIEEEKKINDALHELPPTARAAWLICSLLDEDEPSSGAAVLTMISVAGRMTRYLPPAVRLRVLWHLLETAEEIGARWN